MPYRGDALFVGERTDDHLGQSLLGGKDLDGNGHPDIIIGLSVLAYRYEGLRRVDFEQDVIALLRSPETTSGDSGTASPLKNL